MTSEHDHQKQHAFFQYPHFAVVGASDNQKKWGGLIVHLFKERAKDVIPVNPLHETVDGTPCLKSVYDLPAPEQTPIVIVTQPAHTLRLLSEADELKIPMVWLQPGSYDDIVYSAVKENGALDRVLFAGDVETSDSSDSEPATPDAEEEEEEEGGLVPHHAHAGIAHFFQHVLHNDDAKPASDEHSGPIEDGGPCGTITALRRAGSTIAKDFNATKDYAKTTFNVKG